MKRIGPWLKERRQNAGKSQLDTAYETYVSVETIRSIEKGHIYPRMNHFEKLCGLFGVRPIDYYAQSESPTLESDASPSSTSKKDVSGS